MTLTLKNTNVIGHKGIGIKLDGNEEVIIDGGTIRQNGVGIYAAGQTNRPHLTITGALVKENQIGIHVDSTFFASLPPKLRKSVITANGTGIEVGRPPQGGCFLDCFDLGTAADPGGNTITGNTTTGVFLDIDATVNASGNIWNPNTQAAGNTGQYLVGFEVTGDRSDSLARGKNFFLERVGTLFRF